MANPGWGSAFGKLFDWVPGRKESKEKKIERLKNENVKIQNTKPFDAVTFDRNAATIKQLRSDLEKID